MFAVYASKASLDDPLAALAIGDHPEPEVPEGWLRIKISHASLNRHDIFTLRGITAHPEGISFPMILGNRQDCLYEIARPVRGSSVPIRNWPPKSGEVVSRVVGKTNTTDLRKGFEGLHGMVRDLGSNPSGVKLASAARAYKHQRDGLLDEYKQTAI